MAAPVRYGKSNSGGSPATNPRLTRTNERAPGAARAYTAIHDEEPAAHGPRDRGRVDADGAGPGARPPGAPAAGALRGPPRLRARAPCRAVPVRAAVQLP